MSKTNIPRHIAVEEALRSQTRLLKSQTRLLELLHRTTVIANEASNADEAFKASLEAICTYKQWPVGHLYLTSKAPPHNLVSTTVWYLSDPNQFATFQDITDQYSLDAKQTSKGLLGRVRESGKSVWIRNVINDPNFKRATITSDIGVKAAFGVPVLVGSAVRGVLEFFTTEEENTDDQLLAVLDNIGVQLGRVIEREQADKKLRDKEQLYAQILNSMPDGLFAADKNLCFTHFNRRWLELHGLTEMNIQRGDSLANVIRSLAQRGYYGPGDIETIISGRMAYYQSKEDGELETQFSDGKYVQARKTGLREGGIVANFSDITQQKLAEEMLRDSEANYRKIFENSGVGVIETTAGRSIAQANDWFANLLEYKRGELIGKKIGEITYPEDLHILSEVQAKFFPQKLSRLTFEKRYMKRSGDPVWCEVTITPKNATHDEEKRNIAVVIDISRRKLAEEAREILNDELAHRLKNSMNIVGSLVRFAKQSAPDVNSYEASISGQLKALSVAQEWLFKNDWRGVDFDDLCSEILKPFQVDGSERFLIDVPSPRLPPQLAQIMSLVIHELATNATKYGALSNNEGTVRLEGSVKNYSADGGKSFDELHLVWIENGGPPVKIPTRKGFGTSILNRIVRDQLYGEFNPQWNKDGLHCEIKIRL